MVVVLYRLIKVVICGVHYILPWFVAFVVGQRNMADNLTQKSAKPIEKSKLCNVIHRTTSESLRLGEPDLLAVHPTTLLSSTPNPKKKTSSFQITSVTGSRMSTDGGEDSADDLDESHTDDYSRITDFENETPSYSEDTYSKEEVFFNAHSGVCIPTVLPTSAQYGIAIVPSENTGISSTGEQSSTEITVVIPDIQIGAKEVSVSVNNIIASPKHSESDMKDTQTNPRNDRFKVVKIESTEPFKRGRWVCMDFLDHTTAPTPYNNAIINVKPNPENTQAIKNERTEKLDSALVDQTEVLKMGSPVKTINAQPSVVNVATSFQSNINSLNAPNVSSAYPIISPGQSLNHGPMNTIIQPPIHAPIMNIPNPLSNTIDAVHCHSDLINSVSSAQADVGRNMSQVPASVAHHQSLPPQQMMQVISQANIQSAIQQQVAAATDLSSNQYMPGQSMPTEFFGQANQQPPTSQYINQNSIPGMTMSSANQPVMQVVQTLPHSTTQSMPTVSMIQANTTPLVATSQQSSEHMPQQQYFNAQVHTSQPTTLPVAHQNVPMVTTSIQQPTVSMQNPSNITTQSMSHNMNSSVAQTVPTQSGGSMSVPQQSISQPQTMTQIQTNMPQQHAAGMSLPPPVNPTQQQMAQTQMAQVSQQNQSQLQQPQIPQMVSQTSGQPQLQQQHMPGKQMMSQAHQQQQQQQQQQQPLQQPQQQNMHHVQQQQVNQMQQQQQNIQSQPQQQQQMAQQLTHQQQQVQAAHQMQSQNQQGKSQQLSQQNIQVIQQQQQQQPQQQNVPLIAQTQQTQHHTASQQQTQQNQMQQQMNQQQQQQQMQQQAPFVSTQSVGDSYSGQSGQDFYTSGGSVSVSAQQAQAQAMSMAAGNCIMNNSEHSASIVVNNSGSGTPADVMQDKLLEAVGAVSAAAVAAAAADDGAAHIGQTDDGDSATGTNAVAIDNKIEQAMDLVKSHLMFAVREEVEVLKERIAELMERINQLEVENGILRAHATQETLSQLGVGVGSQATSSINSVNPANGPVS